MKNSRVFSICVACATLAFCGATAHALGTVPESPPPAWNTGAMNFNAVTDYFTTRSNYDESRGSYTRLPTNNDFSVLELRAKGRYAFSNRLMAFGGANVAQSRARDAVNDKTNSEFNALEIGADYLLTHRWLNVVPELEAILPLDRTDTTQTRPLTSDGTFAARAGAFLFKRYEHFRVEGYFGLHVPSESLSKKFMYSLISEVAFARGFSLGGGLDGYESILADGQTLSSRTTVTDRSSAGSERFWSYNPALLEGKIWLGFRPDRAFAVRLGYSKTFNGMRTAEGQSYFLSVAFSTPGQNPRAATPPAAQRETPVHPTPNGEGEQTFTTVPESLDPDIYQDDSAKQNGDDLDSTEQTLERRRHH